MEKMNLEMIRGDTLSFAFEVDFDEAPQKLEKADFSCKVNLDDDEALFHKELGKGIDFSKQDGTKMYYIVRIAPEDTENLEAGMYYYDLSIEMNGDVFTIINGTLKIESDVTTVKTYMTKYQGIKEIKKTSTSGLVDTYTITLTDGTTSTFTVTNGEKGEKGDRGDTGTGLSTEAIDKLEEVGNCLAYTTADGGSKWTELISILRGSSGGGSGETEIKLSSISATYTGGEVATGTVLSNLTGITVTATYSDGTNKTVTGYSLSGEILEGENTITVSYGGKTTTITVTGIAESGGGDTTAELPTDGLVAYFDFRNTTPEINTKQGLTKFNTNQGNGCLFSWSASTFTSSDNYGVKRMARSFMFDKDGGTNQSELGTSFSVLCKGYDLINGFYAWGDHVRGSNVAAFTSAPKYNTSSSQVQVDSVGFGNKQEKCYIDLYFVVDGSLFKLYFNGELVKSYNGTNYEDFVSWYSKVSTIVFGDSNYQTALAIYEKALSEVEITEAKAFLKTLEVA